MHTSASTQSLHTGHRTPNGVFGGKRLSARCCAHVLQIVMSNVVWLLSEVVCRFPSGRPLATTIVVIMLLSRVCVVCNPAVARCSWGGRPLFARARILSCDNQPVCQAKELSGIIIGKLSPVIAQMEALTEQLNFDDVPSVIKNPSSLRWAAFAA